MKAFGIGCFWFGRKAEAHDHQAMVGTEHLAAVRRALEAIPNLNNVEIIEPEHMLWHESEWEQEGQEIYPIDLIIKFNVYLPKRVQDQLFPIRDSQTDTEYFEVFIYYGYYAPVSYISYNTDDQLFARPSDSVVIIPNYLEKEFARTSENVTFNFLGPIPFHADFWLEGEERGTVENFLFTNLGDSGVGYSSITVKYRSNQFISIDSAWMLFIRSTYHHIDYYYNAVRQRNDIINVNTEIQDKLDQLLQLQTAGGVRGSLNRFRKAPKATRDLMILVLQAEMAGLSAGRFLEEAQRRGILPEGSPFTAATVKEIEDQKNRFPIGQIAETVKMFEERYLKNLENGTVLVAGLLGGVVGAIITIIIGPFMS
ncbi:MAG: hypothetical protein U1E42_06210 [Rhodospirillales bacterium]